MGGFRINDMGKAVYINEQNNTFSYSWCVDLFSNTVSLQNVFKLRVYGAKNFYIFISYLSRSNPRYVLLFWSETLVGGVVTSARLMQ